MRLHHSVLTQYAFAYILSLLIYKASIQSIFDKQIARIDRTQKALKLKREGRIAMNLKEIKKFLIDRELTVTQMARELEPDASDLRIRSLAQMLSDLFYGRRWYPSLAERVKDEYGLKLKRPAAYDPKVRLKNAA
jgi:hypothetical protein